MKTISGSILVFGGGELQKSMILLCKSLGLKTVVIDPSPNAICKDIADAFECVGGDDFEGTCACVEKHDIKAVITAATDKPLVMMARVAEKFGFCYIDEKAATIATDKNLMKQVLISASVNCAKGALVDKNNPELPSDLFWPVVVKPLDNSGSRGVFICNDFEDFIKKTNESKQFTKSDFLLVEEFIGGKEYSIESIHSENKTTVIAITEKITTEAPYNVELGHIIPATVSESSKKEIEDIIQKIGTSFNFKYCASHTEVKINERGVFVIETSPRLGGDFITSELVPGSTGVNIERCLISLAFGVEPKIEHTKTDYCGVFYFDLNQGLVKELKEYDPSNNDAIVYYQLNLSKGQEIKPITNSIDRYGCVILNTETKDELLAEKSEIFRIHKKLIEID